MENKYSSEAKRIMQIKSSASAGTMESGDILIEIEPGEFGKQIVKTIRGAVDEYGLEYATVNAVDKGALDCTIRARVVAACQRATGSDAFEWRREA
jgi:citrate lyase subunit gamma (acyl carrier protein)